MVAGTDNAPWSEEAASLQLSRSNIAELAERLPSEAPSWVAAAYESHGSHAATVLALACAAKGWPLPKATLLQLLPEVDHIAHAAALMHHAEGGLLDLVLSLLDEGRLSWEREAIALLLSVHSLGDVAPPPVILTHLRQLARSTVSTATATFVAAAARALRDPELDRLAPRINAESYEKVRGFVNELGGPVLDLLPEYAPPRLVSGYTVKKLEPKVGRNEPCPCGSGKKYKKCCERARPTHPPSAAGLTEAHFTPGTAVEIGDDQFALMRPHELKRLDPKELSTPRLIAGARRLMNFHRWETAEAWVQALTQRTDQPGGGHPEDWWDELADSALGAKQLDLARRCRANVRDPELASRLDLVLLLAARDVPALDQLDKSLRQALATEEYEHLYAIAFGLLDHYPALGMLFARGCLMEERSLDSDMLMQGVEASRDRLGLSVGDPYWDVLDWMSERRRRREGMEHFNTEQQARMRELERGMQARQEEVETLRAELLDQERKLRDTERLLQQSAERAAAPPAATGQRADAGASGELGRLRDRVQRLKALLKEGAQQRQALRADLKSLESAAASVGSHPPSEDPASQSDLPGAHEEPYAVTGTIPLRIPGVDSEQLEHLRTLNPEIATRAVQRLGELASGEAGAWRQVKRLHKQRSLLSVRLGIHHRMLFSVSANQVRLVEVLHRKDLERAIERYRSTQTRGG